MRLGVGAAEIMASRPDLADGIERLSRLGKIDALRHLLHHADLVLTDHEFLVGGDQSAPQPTGGVKYEICPGQKLAVSRLARFCRTPPPRGPVPSWRPPAH